MHYRDMMATIIEVVEPSLAEVGYRTLQSPFLSELDPCVYFGKKSFFEEVEVDLVIYFQPSGIHPLRSDHSSFAVNLTRDSYDVEHFSTIYHKEHKVLPHPYYLQERLASWLWVTDRYNRNSGWKSDYWWVFRDKNELVEACLEVLPQLLHYGIPYLENAPPKVQEIKRKEWRRNKILLGDNEIPF